MNYYAKHSFTEHNKVKQNKTKKYIYMHRDES